jgi:hypothetical protein
MISKQQYVKIAKNYNFKISTNKIKITVFGGKFPIWTKTVTDNKITQQVSHFNYLGYIQY